MDKEECRDVVVSPRRLRISLNPFIYPVTSCSHDRAGNTVLLLGSQGIADAALQKGQKALDLIQASEPNGLSIGINRIKLRLQW